MWVWFVRALRLWRFGTTNDTWPLAKCQCHNTCNARPWHYWYLALISWANWPHIDIFELSFFQCANWTKQPCGAINPWVGGSMLVGHSFMCHVTYREECDIMWHTHRHVRTHTHTHTHTHTQKKRWLMKIIFILIVLSKPITWGHIMHFDSIS